MIKQRTILEIKKEERLYTFECTPDSPLGELHDVLAEMKSAIVQMIVNNNEKKEEPKADEEI